jgi:dolichyl-phosphate beta-glucosyltransferase
VRANLARFAAVGSLVTAVDVGVFLARWRGGRRSVPAADAAALVASGTASWALHRAITFRDDPYRRWLHQHEAFLAAGVAGAAVDVAVTSALLTLTGRRDVRAGLAAKLPAVAAGASVRWALHRRSLFHIVREEHVARDRSAPLPGTVRLSVVVPAYHEAGRIGTTVRRLREALEGVDGGVEIIVVDDGPDPASAVEAREAGADQVISHSSNRGKGAAVRTGVLAANGRTVAFTDADLAYSPEQLIGLLDEVEAGWDVVVGSRRHDQTTTLVRAGRLRELGGRVINLLTMSVLLGAYRDTQCGMKAFSSEAARAIFERAQVDGFGFDIELFVVAERNGMSVREVPVTVSNSERSTVQVVPATVRLLGDLFEIRRRAREGRYQVHEARRPDLHH